MFQRKLLLLTIALLLLPGLFPVPGAAADTLTITPDGGLSCGPIRARLAWFDGQWRMTGQENGTVIPAPGYPARTAVTCTLNGNLKLFHDAGLVNLQESITLQPHAVEYHAELNGNTLECRSAVFILELPLAEFGDKKLMADAAGITLDKENPKADYPVIHNCRKLQIPFREETITITGEFTLTVQDERNYGGTFYSLRLSGQQPDKTRQNFHWDLKISNIDTGVLPEEKRNLVITPVDIRKNVNMSWRDDIPGDRKGGWTDQGENDVRDIETGRREFCGVPFDLIDPARNGGRSCMIFAGPDREYMLPETRIENINLKGEILYFLHGLAWAPEDEVPVAHITIDYTDGSREMREVRSNRDVCNWWSRMRTANAQIAWQGRNPQSETTLYLSGFELDPSKTVAALTLKPTGTGVWLVGALSIGDRAPALEPPERHVVTADDANYRALTPGVELRIEPGSALDFSGLNHCPAGRYGFVRAAGENYEFTDRPGEPVRFYGVNLCWSASLLSHEQSEELAARLAALGYNTVRIHHYDMMLTEKMPRSTELDPVVLDKIDYLFHQLKEHGIYVTLDLYTYRIPKPEEFPNLRIRDLHDFRAAFPVVPEVRENQKAFSRALLTHVNPYTRLAYRDDPALYAICTVNENLLPAPWKEHPQLPAIYREKFAQWCTAQQIAVPENFSDSREFLAFLLDLQQEQFDEMSGFLRDELGVKALLSDNNNAASFSQSAERSSLDYTDVHTYWEHPIFIEKPWELPHYYPQQSAVRAGGMVPRVMMPARIIGKPLAVTELNFLFPNRYRGEGGLLTGAYASFQNWTAIYRFTYAESNATMFEPRSIFMFDTVHDPIQLLTDRIGSVFFRSFAAAPGRNVVPLIFTREDYPGYAEYSRDFSALGLLTRIGTVDAYRHDLRKTPLPFGVVTEAVTNPIPGVEETLPLNAELFDGLTRRQLIPAIRDGVYRSDTGQLELDPQRGTLTVKTARGEGAVLPAGESAELERLTITDNSEFATFALLSPRGEELSGASTLVLFHLTDVMNNNLTFRDRGKTILESYGELPLLARRGTARIQLRKSAPETAAPEIYALDLTGKRQKALNVEETPTHWAFNIDTFGAPEPVMAYEIIQTPSRP